VEILPQSESYVKVRRALRKRSGVNVSLWADFLPPLNPFPGFVIVVVDLHFDENARLVGIAIKDRKVNRLPLPLRHWRSWDRYAKAPKEESQRFNLALPMTIAQIGEQPRVNLAEAVTDRLNEICGSSGESVGNWLAQRWG
jgi:hypothetical protein